VKLLADVDAFRKDGQCPVCAARDDESEYAGGRARLLKLLEGQHRAMVAAFAERGPEARALEDDAFIPRARVEEMAEELARARLQALREEHGIPA
jgi:hypothetical protein